MYTSRGEKPGTKVDPFFEPAAVAIQVDARPSTFPLEADDHPRGYCRYYGCSRGSMTVSGTTTSQAEDRIPLRYPGSDFSRSQVAIANTEAFEQ